MKCGVYSPTKENRDAFVTQVAPLFPFPILSAATLGDALAGAEIVTLVTRAKEAFLHATEINQGTHINAAGSVLPDQAEVSRDVLTHAKSVIVDNRRNALKTSREISDWVTSDPSAEHRITTLGERLALPSTDDPDVGYSVFKPMGMGLSDLAIAVMAYERAKAQGRGTWTEAMSAVRPSWTTKQ